MSRRLYTLTVAGCALSWFLVGLHVPVLHDVLHDLARAGAPRGWLPPALLALFLVLALAETRALLRAPAPWGGRPAPPPPAA